MTSHVIKSIGLMLLGSAFIAIPGAVAVFLNICAYGG